MIADLLSPLRFHFWKILATFAFYTRYLKKKSKKDQFLLVRRKRIHGECMGLFLVFDLTSIAFKVACITMQISDNIHEYRKARKNS